MTHKRVVAMVISTRLLGASFSVFDETLDWVMNFGTWSLNTEKNLEFLERIFQTPL